MCPRNLLILAMPLGLVALELNNRYVCECAVQCIATQVDQCNIVCQYSHHLVTQKYHRTHLHMTTISHPRTIHTHACTHIDSAIVICPCQSWRSCQRQRHSQSVTRMMSALMTPLRVLPSRGSEDLGTAGGRVWRQERGMMVIVSEQYHNIVCLRYALQTCPWCT